MPKEYPDSPEYLARQAARQKELERVRAKLEWTDAQFLAERDAAYVAQERSYVEPTIASIKMEMRDDNDIEGYMRKYGTDEG